MATSDERSSLRLEPGSPGPARPGASHSDPRTRHRRARRTSSPVGLGTPQGSAPPVIVRPDGVLESFLLRVFRVPPELAGMRMDVFVAHCLRNTSRTRARSIVETSAFSPAGRRLKPNDRTRPEDYVALWRPPFEDPDGTDEVPLRTLYEDPHLLVIDKPPLMAVHPTARYHQSTVLKRLQAERPGAFLSLIHRLDRETSGILLLAKTREADRAFKRLLEDRSVAVALRSGSPAEWSKGQAAAVRRGAALRTRVRKTYLAITWGVPPAGVIDTPLLPDLENPLRVKMRVMPRGLGFDAETAVEVLDRRDDYALVSCELLTGRQHQIRVHLASIGCPIVGDKLYGPDERLHARAADGELTTEDLRRLELARQALHAHRYSLPHAVTGEPLELVSPLPEDLQQFWNALPAGE